MSAEVVVNGRFLGRRTSGVERYAGEILRCLGESVQIVRPRRALPPPAGHLWEQLILPRRITAGATLWSPANSGPVWVTDQVLTLHDLSTLEHSEWFQPAFARWYRLLLPVLVRRVRAVITSSEYVRRKVMARFKLPEGRVTAVPGGVDGALFHPAYDKDRGGCYILFAGSLEPRKNLAVLVSAWKKIADRQTSVSLVIAGGSGHVFRPVQIAGAAPRLHLTGYVSDEQLARLYAGAAAFVLPSLDEGFGLTALEAMACGAPVIAARRGALPEVVGDAGLLFDPEDPAALADLLEQCLSDSALARTLREKGMERARAFPWHRAAEATWAVLRGNNGN